MESVSLPHLPHPRHYLALIFSSAAEVYYKQVTERKRGALGLMELRWCVGNVACDKYISRSTSSRRPEGCVSPCREGSREGRISSTTANRFFTTINIVKSAHHSSSTQMKRLDLFEVSVSSEHFRFSTSSASRRDTFLYHSLTAWVTERLYWGSD